jgi:hypothetical protein
MPFGLEQTSVALNHLPRRRRLVPATSSPLPTFPPQPGRVRRGQSYRGGRDKPGHDPGEGAGGQT